MAKTMIIKGADFSDNRLAVVSFDAVPCTALSLSESTITNTTYNGTSQLTATPTPENTTDTLSWASSDDSVATVVDGLVTFVGVGTATITATCGEQTATCSISSQIVADANTLFSAFNGYQLTTTDLSLNPPKDCSGVYPLAKARIYADDVVTPHKAFTGSSSYGDIMSAYPIMLPKNTATIEVVAPSEFSGNAKVVFFKASEQTTYASAGDVALVVQYTTGIAKSNGKFTFTKTEATADAFAFQLNAGSGNASNVTGDVTVTFKAAS